MANQTINTHRNYSICILSFTLVIILGIVVAGICVRFLIEENISRVILIILIIILTIVGIVALTILEILRRKALKIKNTNNNNVQETVYRFQPSAPPGSNASSWSFSKDYSKRTTLPA